VVNIFHRLVSCAFDFIFWIPFPCHIGVSQFAQILKLVYFLVGSIRWSNLMREKEAAENV